MTEQGRRDDSEGRWSKYEWRPKGLATAPGDSPGVIARIAAELSQATPSPDDAGDP